MVVGCVVVGCVVIAGVVVAGVAVAAVARVVAEEAVVAGVVVARRIEVARGSRRLKRRESAGGENLACGRVRGDNQGTRSPGKASSACRRAWVR